MAQSLTSLLTTILGNDFDPTVYTTQATQAVNDALREISREFRIPALDRSVTLTTTPASTTVSTGMPTDIARIVNLTDTVRSVPLDQVYPDQLDTLLSTAVGRPTVYALFGGGITVWPSPDQAYSLQLRYGAEAPQLVNPTDAPVIPDAYAHALVEYARARLFRAEDDYQSVAFWDGEYEKTKQKMRLDLQHFGHRQERVPGPYAGAWVPRFGRPLT